VDETVTISYRGASYEIGRGQGFYGIWHAGMSQSRAIEWWPETPEGWYRAWSRFTEVEAPGTIAPVTEPSPAAASPAAASPAAGGPALARSGAGRPPVARASTAALVPSALVAIGVVLGIAGLFPGYLGGASLAQQSAELVPHALYLAAWTASAALILLGGTRLRMGALLGIGTSIVTFGLFFADAGTAIASSAHLAGPGLVLGLIGWTACAVGSGLAFRLGPAGAPGSAAGLGRGPVLTLTLTAVAGLGAAIAFAPSWDSYTLRTAAGVTQTVTAGNAFANPGLVIFGDVAVMAALVAVVVAAVLWRPVRQGAALLAGAIVPMAAQAISAFVLLGQATSPAQFGISPAEAARAGLSISSGGTAAFWIYCVFVAALIAACTRMVISPRRAMPYAASPVADTFSPAGMTGPPAR
jgi:hypothetical protein